MRVGSVVMSAAASTVVVGLNGALQKRFVLEPSVSLVPGNVHRAAQVQIGVGGKGQDVAVTLSCLKFNGNLKLAQFIGTQGPEGTQVYDMLRDLLGESAMELSVRPTNSGMRTCTSIVASDATTELVEPSGTIVPEELQELIDKLKQQQEKDAVAALCFMGSMPPGCMETTYADIYKAVATPDTICVIDSVNGLPSLFQTIAEMKSKDKDDNNNGYPTIFKVNASELCRLTSVKRSTQSEADGVQSTEIVQAVTSFLQTNPSNSVTAIAITDGAHPAYLAEICNTENEFKLYQLPIAKLDKKALLYPIGAGDSVAAGTLAAWKCLNGDDKCLPNEIQKALTDSSKTEHENILTTAFGFGLACGSSSCLQEENSVLKIEDTLKLFQNAGKPAFVSSHTFKKQAV